MRPVSILSILLVFLPMQGWSAEQVPRNFFGSGACDVPSGYCCWSPFIPHLSTGNRQVSSVLEQITDTHMRERLAEEWIKASMQQMSLDYKLYSQWLSLQRDYLELERQRMQVELEKMKLQAEIEKLSIEKLKLERENLQLRAKLREKLEKGDSK